MFRFVKTFNRDPLALRPLHKTNAVRKKRSFKLYVEPLIDGLIYQQMETVASVSVAVKIPDTLYRKVRERSMFCCTGLLYFL